MTVSLDARQSLAEIEHALFKSFPYTSASITHVTSSDGVVTIQVSWVPSAGGTDLAECNAMMGVACLAATEDRIVEVRRDDEDGRTAAGH